jgi:hypothetical protein
MVFRRSLSDIAQLDGPRPRTLRAYGYELAAAAADARFSRPAAPCALCLLFTPEVAAWRVCVLGNNRSTATAAGATHQEYICEAFERPPLIAELRR